MSDLGTRIYQKRTELNMTMTELANKLGVQASAVNKWEKGIVTNIKRSTIQEMARIFNVSPVWLAYGEEPQPIPYLENNPIELADEVAGLTIKFMQLNEANKRVVMTMIDSLLSNQ